MFSEILSTGPGCEIVSERLFNAPAAQVFTAWTDPKHLELWWGPAGFTNTFHEYDLRPGGKWKFTMHGPEQGHYQNECEFITIDKPLRLSWQRISKPIFQVQVSFEERSSAVTHVVFKMVFTSPEECNKLKNFVPEKNEENFDRLDAELKRMIGDPLIRFVEKHERDFARALSEIKNGRKQSHWMWYIFPQIQGLGFSETSRFYAIKNREEAHAFLQHPLLGRNMLEITGALMQLPTDNATTIFGKPDDMKLHSSLTLFSALKNTNPLFQKGLDKFFNGQPDGKTLALIK